MQRSLTDLDDATLPGCKVTTGKQTKHNWAIETQRRYSLNDGHKGTADGDGGDERGGVGVLGAPPES